MFAHFEHQICDTYIYSQTWHVVAYLIELQLILFTLAPESRLFFFQNKKYFRYTFALAVVRYRHLPVIKVRLRTIRKVRVSQRVGSGDTFRRVETQHAGNQVQQRITEQPRPRMLLQMRSQAALKGRGRHEMRAHVIGSVAVGAQGGTLSKTHAGGNAAAAQLPAVAH